LNFLQSYNVQERSYVYLNVFRHSALNDGFDGFDCSQCLLCALHLLAVALCFDSIACPFAVGAQLCHALLLWRFGQVDFKDSHKSIYELFRYY
jgi:hypothetical protein